MRNWIFDNMDSLEQWIFLKRDCLVIFLKGVKPFIERRSRLGVYSISDLNFLVDEKIEEFFSSGFVINELEFVSVSFGLIFGDFFDFLFFVGLISNVNEFFEIGKNLLK